MGHVSVWPDGAFLQDENQPLSTKGSRVQQAYGVQHETMFTGLAKHWLRTCEALHKLQLQMGLQLKVTQLVPDGSHNIIEELRHDLHVHAVEAEKDMHADTEPVILRWSSRLYDHFTYNLLDSWQSNPLLTRESMDEFSDLIGDLARHQA